ncbi:MAG: beta-ketoacyl-ACP synthase, partial [Deltaproteobacteria bacterium]|nr:beta-ketoacyl-ACP synthase [Deltaproteobacteria bacterium]
MKYSPSRIGIMCLALLVAGTVAVAAAQTQYPNLAPKELVIKRGFTKEALSCIECHGKKMPGILEGWRASRMASAGISCYDCHVVEKTSPMASQCEGLKGTKIFISPMVSSKTCSRCHPQEVEQFLKSGHAELASGAVTSPERAGLSKLQFYYEGGGFMTDKKFTWTWGTPKEATAIERAARASGCQPCHGTKVELGPDNKPINETWPGGVGT